MQLTEFVERFSNILNVRLQRCGFPMLSYSHAGQIQQARAGKNVPQEQMQQRGAGKQSNGAQETRSNN
jgi:hypothetical protein